MTSPVGKAIFNDTTDIDVDPQDDGKAAGPVDEDVAGAYLVLGVPQYDDAGSSAYLRLGAAITNAGDPTVWTKPNANGEDLASLVQGFADDGRDRTGPAPAGFQAIPETLITGQNGGIHEGEPTDPEGRKGETKILHGKGGIRDHSDGNRVTTTRGDKVEVVRGNYKLLVLGRQDTRKIAEKDARLRLVGASAGVDMSGGLVDTDSGDLRAPDVAGLNVTYNWQQNSDGTWAWTQTTIVGSATPDKSNGNYRVVNNSWFDYQRTQTGSAQKRVSHIGQETHADTLWTKVDVANTNTTTTTGKELFSFTFSPSINDVTHAALATELRKIGIGLEVDVGDMIALVQVAAILNANLWHAFVFDDHIGLHSDVHIGAHNEVRIGEHDEPHTVLHAETHLGEHADLHLGPHIDVHILDHFQHDEVKLDIAEGKIMNGEKEIGSYAGPTVTKIDSMDNQTAVEHALKLASGHMKL